MATYLCTATDLQSRMSAIGYNLSIEDDPTATTQSLQRSSNKIRYYCESLYEFTNLVNDSLAGGWTNDRCTDLAVYYLRGRKGNPRPDSVAEDYKEAIVELMDVHAELYQIPTIPQRHVSSPAFSNVRVDAGFSYKKIRVEQTISDPSSPVGYSQFPDWVANFTFEF